jgi:hypothetical protein
MTKEVEKLTKMIEEQAQLFLLDAGEFYPFGSCINKKDQLKPIGVYFDVENPSSSEVIAVLEMNIRDRIQSGDYNLQR